MSFDTLAPYYRMMEAVGAGGLMQRCRTRWLGEVRNARRALLVGEGSGRMMEVMAQQMPLCEFTVLDQSKGMLRESEKCWRKAGFKQRITFEQANILKWQPEGNPFDLVVINFFFDCFKADELEQVVATLSRSSAPSASWLVSDFCVPASGWRNLRARLFLAMAYGFFRTATDISARHLTEPDDFLNRAGYVLRQRERFDFGLLHADLWRRGK